MGTQMPLEAHAFLNSRTIWSRCDGVASMGTRSLSCRFTPQAPTSPRRSTNAAGPIDSLTASPKGSRPRFPTVHKPKENLCSGLGSYCPVFAMSAAPLGISRLRTENAVGRPIHLAISLITFVQSCDVLFRRFHPGGYPHDRRARFVDRLPHPRPNAGQNCCPISRPFFGFHDLDFFPINIGLDLPPQPRTRSASTQTDVIHRHTHLAEKSKTVAQAEDYAFKNRANHVRSRVRRRKAD